MIKSWVASYKKCYYTIILYPGSQTNISSLSGPPSSIASPYNIEGHCRDISVFIYTRVVCMWPDLLKYTDMLLISVVCTVIQRLLVEWINNIFIISFRVMIFFTEKIFWQIYQLSVAFHTFPHPQLNTWKVSFPLFFPFTKKMIFNITNMLPSQPTHMPHPDASKHLAPFYRSISDTFLFNLTADR